MCIKTFEKKFIDTENYVDLTLIWLKDATPNSHLVKDRSYFEFNGINYIVDGKSVVLDYSKKEKEVAIWIENTFGGEIYMLPRINMPERISTPDYLWKNEYWDLKYLFGSSKHMLDSAVKKPKRQSLNFIIDISNSKINNEEAIRQIKLIFQSKNRQWIQKIILKKFEKVILKKRNCPPVP